MMPLPSRTTIQRLAADVVDLAPARDGGGEARPHGIPPGKP
jgi:hypothetical protein